MTNTVNIDTEGLQLFLNRPRDNENFETKIFFKNILLKVYA